MRASRARAGTALLAAAAVAAGCARAPAAPPAATAAWVRASLRFSPDPPVAREHDAVRVRLTSPGGRPLSGAAVSVQAYMPGMSMPPEGGPLTAEGAGRYTGTLLPVMGGRWAAAVHVAAGGRTATLTVPFEVRE